MHFVGSQSVNGKIHRKQQDTKMKSYFFWEQSRRQRSGCKKSQFDVLFSAKSSRESRKSAGEDRAKQ